MLQLPDAKMVGIKLITIPKYSTDSVAEYLIFLMFSLRAFLIIELLRTDYKYSITYHVNLIGKYREKKNSVIFLRYYSIIINVQ